MKKAILNLAAELDRRAVQLWEDRRFLPWWTRVDRFPGTVAGHIDLFRRRQVSLRELLNRWGSDDCGGPGNGGKLPGDVWNLASMKTPQPLRRTPPPAGRNWIDGRWVATGVAAYGWYRVLRAMNLGGGFGAAFGGGGPLYGGGGGRPAYDE